ncbi:hypothetical protein AgCh_038099 [Apium graveolens]
MKRQRMVIAVHDEPGHKKQRYEKKSTGTETNKKSSTFDDFGEDSQTDHPSNLDKIYKQRVKTKSDDSRFKLAVYLSQYALLDYNIGKLGVNAAMYEEGQRLALDLIDEVRDEAHSKIVKYHKKALFYYNLRVKERFFKQGDLVLRKVEASGVGQKGKLAPNWEGPYKVKSVRGRGTYKLETMDGFEVPRTWHAQNLKVYYV